MMMFEEEELQPYDEAIQLVYNAALYVGRVAYSGGDEFLYKVALEAELKVRFERWSRKTGLPSPFILTEAVLAYQFPVSRLGEEEAPVMPPCTHLRADIWIYGSEPGFPSMVLELKAVDKLQSKHRKQAHEYFCLMRRSQAEERYRPKLAAVINFRGAFVKEGFTATAAYVAAAGETASVAKKRKNKKEGEEAVPLHHQQSPPAAEITEVFVASNAKFAEEHRVARPINADEQKDEIVQFAVGTATPFLSGAVDLEFRENVELMKWWLLG